MQAERRHFMHNIAKIRGHLSPVSPFPHYGFTLLVDLPSSYSFCVLANYFELTKKRSQCVSARTGEEV